MLGLNEILIIVGVGLLILLFGKKSVLKGIKEFFSLKREVKELVDEETKKEDKVEEKEFSAKNY